MVIYESVNILLSLKCYFTTLHSNEFSDIDLIEWIIGSSPTQESNII